jgi:hypothetical protein
VAAAALISTSAFAQAADAPVKNESPETLKIEGQNFLLVSNIKTMVTNREFQQNVQVVQNQRQTAIQLRQRRDQAFTTPEKEVLTNILIEVVAKLDEHNKAMAKSYLVTIDRNYVVQIVKSRVYGPISDDDYARLSEVEKNDKEKVITRPVKDKDGKEVTTRFKYVSSINGVAENETFRQDIQRYSALRQRATQLAQVQPRVTKDDDKKKIEEAIKNTNDEITKDSTEFYKKYSFQLKEGQIAEIEESNLYANLSEEELKKAKDAQVKAKEEAGKKAADKKPEEKK